MNKIKKPVIAILVAIFLISSLPMISSAASASMEKPGYLSLSLGADEGKEYDRIVLSWKNSEEIKKAIAAGKNVEYEIDVKHGTKAWNSESGNPTIRENLSLDENDKTVVVIRDSKELNIEDFDIYEESYSFRVRYLIDGVGNPFSNVVRIGRRPNYQNASAWSEEELKLASRNGFIPPCMQADMKLQMSREEFTEIIIRVYEKNQDMHLIVGDNPYKDTDNESVIKATSLGIVQGVGHGCFAPKDNVTRQEMAVIFTRLLEKLDYATGDINAMTLFDDHDEISDWAVESVYKLQGFGLVEGVGNNKFTPKTNATREQGAVVGQRLYELLENN